ncbi:hypothetical protein SAMN00790413_04785 [Deinococcus hopiensis KR-140]|uniref:Uncharacterized protein n=1 Tax=Deinococcus hopiensis KR-140 TaxID=695939 RepID=A0A1W1UMC4_9DEIO|nr:hypothetical protein SAMN00790413_04785 [Deinococcus hopiensis KR-140]
MAARKERLEVIAQWIGDNPVTVTKVYLHVFKQDTAMPTLGLLSRPDVSETTDEAPEQSPLPE